MLDEIEEFITGVRGGSDAERLLTTIVFTDIVGSTERAALLGDDRWRDLLDNHDTIVRHELQRFGGREVNTAGDGFVATFSSPSAAIACADAIVDAVRVLGIEVRVGIHAGEVEVRGGALKDDIAGMAVHIGARVAALAGPSEVLVSSTVRDIVTGSRHRFADRGENALKGVPGQWRLYALVTRARGRQAVTKATCSAGRGARRPRVGCLRGLSASQLSLRFRRTAWYLIEGVRMTDVHVSLPPALRRALDLLADPPANPDVSKGYLDLLGAESATTPSRRTPARSRRRGHHRSGRCSTTTPKPSRAG